MSLGGSHDILNSVTSSHISRKDAQSLQCCLVCKLVSSYLDMPLLTPQFHKCYKGRNLVLAEIVMSVRPPCKGSVIIKLYVVLYYMIAYWFTYHNQLINDSKPKLKKIKKLSLCVCMSVCVLNKSSSALYTDTSDIQH